MRPHIRYALIGIVLGLGAPLGSLGLRIAFQWPDKLTNAIVQEWIEGRYYYIYMTLGTTIAFGLFGFVLGRRNEDLGDLSATDGLTRLYNHRTIQERLTQELQRADRYHTPLTCLMLDIDDFKKVNDRNGHLFGDNVLATTADLIRSAVRQTDLAGRYGGEEFLVLMPQTEGTVALTLAERILKAVSDQTYPSEAGDVSVTLSIGLATYPDSIHGVKSQNALLSAADQALYKAKRSGKNRTVMWKF